MARQGNILLLAVATSCFAWSGAVFAEQSVQSVALTTSEAPPLVSAPSDTEINALGLAMASEVPKQVGRSEAEDVKWIAAGKATLEASGRKLVGDQLAILVDRSVSVQELRLVVVRVNAPWVVIGAVKVSTGQKGRFDHYVTPTGVFIHDAGILDYRAEGTFNENHIRGYGVRGMRIWDLGWQIGTKGWRKDGETGEIRMQMHATDPDVLEPRMGTPASQGCIRIPAALNRFIDKYGVIDADYEAAAKTDRRYGGVLRNDRTPSSLAGRAIIVFDSSGG